MSGWGLAIGAIVGAGIGAYGSMSAANTQSNAQLQAAGLMGQTQAQGMSNQLPYMQGGYGALNQLLYGFGQGNPNASPTNPNNLPINPQTGQPYTQQYFLAYDQAGDPNPSNALRDAQTQYNEYQSGSLTPNGAIPQSQAGAPTAFAGGPNAVPTNTPAAGAGIATNAIHSLGGGTTMLGGAANPYAAANNPAAAAGGAGGGSSGGLGFGSLTSGFTAQDFLNNLQPNYNFMQQQGAMATRNADTPGVGALSGPALKDLMSYNQNFAQNAYQQSYNNWMGTNNAIFSRLSNIAGLGQSAASNVGNNNTTLGVGQAGAIAGAGASQAAGTVGVANNLGNSSIPLAYLLSQQNGNNNNSGGGGGGAPMGDLSDNQASMISNGL
jgi:hypothetical protein